MPTHEILNVTPFAAAILPAQDRDGRDLAVAAVRATFLFTARGEVTRAPPAAQIAVLPADAHLGDPATTSVRLAGEATPARPGTDVAILGHAYGRGRKEVEAGFQVRDLRKTVVVSGPRQWVAGFPVAIAGPVAFEQAPLRWEQAFGGTYEDAGRPVPFHENPVGVGFARELVDRSPLPSVEARGGRVRTPKDRPTPGGLGFVPQGWKQRSRFAGTYDAAWEKVRRPLFPEDLDERFWNAVPQDQVLRPKLAGGERLVLLNVHPDAETVALAVPRVTLAATFRIRDAETALPMTADTLLVEPDEGRLAITYRAILPVGDDRLRLRSVVFRERGTPAPALAPARGA
jgi:hypothetical protein